MSTFRLSEASLNFLASTAGFPGSLHSQLEKLSKKVKSDQLWLAAVLDRLTEIYRGIDTYRSENAIDETITGSVLRRKITGFKKKIAEMGQSGEAVPLVSPPVIVHEKEEIPELAIIPEGDDEEEEGDVDEELDLFVGLEAGFKDSGLDFVGIDFAHGLLTSFAVGPGGLDLPFVLTSLRQIEEYAPAPLWEADEATITPMVTESFGFIEKSLSAGAYIPMVSYDKKEKEDLRLWSLGFLTGFARRELAWFTPATEGYVMTYLYPIMKHAKYSPLPKIADIAPRDMRASLKYICTADSDTLTLLVEGLYAIFHPVTGETVVPGESGPLKPVSVEPKIGRNDPCSCGSGKKYKKCCGVNG